MIVQKTVRIAVSAGGDGIPEFQGKGRDNVPMSAGGSTPAWHAVVFALPTAVALVLGVWSLTLVDPQRIGGTGPIAVLPPA